MDQFCEFCFLIKLSVLRSSVPALIGIFIEYNELMRLLLLCCEHFSSVDLVNIVSMSNEQSVFSPSMYGHDYAN